MAVRHIPQGFHSLVPTTCLKGADKAIDFYKKVFHAEEKARYAGPDGVVHHAELQLGDSVLMLGEAQGIPVANLSACLYVQDCDAVFKRAVDAGATVKRDLQDMFYGDRSGTVVDPFGNEWAISTHKEDVSHEEMERRMRTQPH